MFTREELKERQKGIGASEIATVLGCNPYSNRYELYHQKTIEDPTQLETQMDENDPRNWGTRMEPFIAELYADKTGAKLKTQSRIHHGEEPLFYASPDRIVSLPNVSTFGLEIKNVTDVRKFKLWGPSASQDALIPEQYYFQVAQCMFVMDFKRWDVAALMGGGELRTYTFHRDYYFDSIILEEGEAFWKNYVMRREAPDPNEEFKSIRAKDFMRKLYPTVEVTEVQLPESLMKWSDIRKESKVLAKQYAESAAIAEAHILHHMGHHSKGILSDGSYFLRSIMSKKTYTVEAHEELRFTYKDSKKEKSYGKEI